MILHLSEGTPLLLRAAAATALALHIGGGAVGIVAGAAALTFRKGSRPHRLAGTVFVVAMLTMTAIGACVAPFLPDRGSSIAGALTFYLVVTAWLTIRRRDGGVGLPEVGAFVAAVGIASAGIVLGARSADNPGGMIDPHGQSYDTAYALAGLAALAAAGDLRMLLRRGIHGAQRIARHLWRMCFALLIAAASFFLGQQQVMPAFMRGSSYLIVPELAVLGAMLFWLCRVWFTRLYKGPGARPLSPAS